MYQGNKLLSQASRLMIGSAMCGSFLSVPVYAQESDNTIIVTAQKREQNVLDVPVAITAVVEEALDAAQVTEFDDIASVSPSLTITRSGNQNQNTISLRGIGTFSFSTAVESAVLVVVDDVALLQAGQAFGNLTDLSRVEVLRGPQGTLFGKNASAGVINIVTKDPTDYLTGYVEGTATTDEEYGIRGAISGPIGANAGFRVNAYYSDYEGYLTNLENGNSLGARESWGLRGKFEGSIDALDLALILDYSESSDNGGIDTYRRLDQVDGAGNPINQDFAEALVGVTPGPENRDVRINNENVNDSEQFLSAVKLDYDLGFATLSSISSYQSWDYYAENDQDYSAAPTIFQYGPINADQISQELRLTSPTSNAFDYLVGLYYANGTTDRHFTREVPGFLAFLRQNWDSRAKTESFAAFAQLGYDISDDTQLTAGGRLNREKVSVRFDDQRNTPSQVYEGSASETAFTWKVALQHDIGDEAMAFGSVSTGYKGQAFDISSGFNQRRADNPIASEDSINYEIGLKGQALGNRAQFQLVAFWSDYKDFQAQGINTSLPIAQFELTNVGKLRTRGIELDTVFTPSDSLTLFASAAFIDAKIRSFPFADCYFGQTEAQGCSYNAELDADVQDLAGKDLNNSPDFKFNAGFNFEQPVSSSMGFFISGNYQWQSKVNFDLTQNPRDVQGAYGIADAAIGLQSADDAWRVSLFVNNLFDQDYVTRIIDDTPRNDPFILQQQVPRNAERYFGVRVRVGL